MNPVLESILTRRSVRSYLNKPIPIEDLKIILKAGSYAPNGMGMQNWRYTAIHGREAMKKVNEAVRETLLTTPITAETSPYDIGLIENAKNKNTNYFYQAPTVIIVSHQKDNGSALADSALGIGNMMLAAHSLGIGSCWVNLLPSLTHKPLIRKLLTELDIPANHIVYGTAVMGYPAEEPRPADSRKDVIRIF